MSTTAESSTLYSCSSSWRDIVFSCGRGPSIGAFLDREREQRWNAADRQINGQAAVNLPPRDRLVLLCRRGRPQRLPDPLVAVRLAVASRVTEIDQEARVPA